MTSPDPVIEAAAYQRHLLDALGDEDPADAEASTPAAIRNLIDEAGPALRVAPAAGEWSVIECIGHIVDAEVVYSGRYRWTIAHDGPDMIGYDQDRWVARLRHVEDDPAELIALFEALRAANLALWRRSTPEERARVGMHRERGPESFDLSFRLVAGHDRIHLRQASATLDAARGALSAGGTAPSGR
jgi:hypothetical protein